MTTVLLDPISTTITDTSDAVDTAIQALAAEHLLPKQLRNCNIIDAWLADYRLELWNAGERRTARYLGTGEGIHQFYCRVASDLL